MRGGTPAQSRTRPPHRLSFSSFFFQAEDGIRDDLVTGVQTCALPISLDRKDARLVGGEFHVRGLLAGHDFLRSEERRVGKECRSRWSRYHLKKKHLVVVLVI